MYTDGGSYNNGDRKGDGSWAYLIVNDGDPNEIIVTCEFIQNTTNNRTEMMAVIEGLKYLNKFDDKMNVANESSILSKMPNEIRYKLLRLYDVVPFTRRVINKLKRMLHR